MRSRDARQDHVMTIVIRQRLVFADARGGLSRFGRNTILFDFDIVRADGRVLPLRVRASARTQGDRPGWRHAHFPCGPRKPEPELTMRSRDYTARSFEGVRTFVYRAPLAVGSIVLEAGGSEDEAIAALLHDAAEDPGGRETSSWLKSSKPRSVKTRGTRSP